MPEVLIVGAQSQIGGALVSALPDKGWSVVSTTRRNQADNAPECLSYDLSAPPSEWPQFPAVEAAVICAAVTSQRACEDDPASSSLVNTEHAVALARQLHEAGTFVLLLSTVAVFDGSLPHQNHESETTPTNAYGRQKAAAEKAVLEAKTAAVLRLSKVMGPEMPLLKQWQSDLAASKPITAFNDVTFAPISTLFVAELIDLILRREQCDIYHASGDEDLPYSEFAGSLCDALKAPHSLCSVQSAHGGAKPVHTTLDMAKERGLFSIEQPVSTETIRQVIHTVSG